MVLLASCATAGKSEDDNIVTLDTAIREAATDIENRLMPGTRVALLSFSSPSERFTEYILEELSVCLVNSGKLVVVDRKELDLIRQEERFQLSGEVSDESAQAIGKKLGAQYIVTGSLSSLGKSYRFRVKTLTVETATVAVSTALDISSGEEKVVILLAGTKPPTEKEPGRMEEPLPEGLLYEAIGGKSITITKYIGNATSVSIPATIDGLPVTTIGNEAFSGCTSLTIVTVPSSVTSIGNEAFYFCLRLTSFTIPSSVTSIGNEAFFWCTELTSITIPSSVTTIGDGAFSYCKSMMNITVDMKNNTYISVNGVLFNKAGKTILCYPAGKAGAYTIPSSVTIIGNRAFLGCADLTRITIPSSVTSIGNEAFRGCTSLTSVTVPSSVTTIGDGAFSFCYSMMNITVDMKNNAYISVNGVLFDKAVKSLICYPTGPIGPYTIPSSVTSIGNWAFASSGLTSIIIPSSVTSIGNKAFFWCRLLRNVTLSHRTRVGESAFDSGVQIQYRD